MIYDDYYRLAIFVNGYRHSHPYPASFWFNPPTDLYEGVSDYRFDHSTQFSLHLHGMQQMTFRVELQIMHGLYTSDTEGFIDSLQLEFIEWSRAEPQLS
jgi:hypothetical protein